MVDSRMLLVLLCGLPGAGKTTLAKHLQQSMSSKAIAEQIFPAHAHKTPNSFHHICYDQHLLRHLSGSRFQVQGKDKDDAAQLQFDAGKWKSSREAAFRETEALMSEHAQSKSGHCLLCVDDNLFYRSMRFKFYKMARRWGAALLIVHVATDKAECLRRNSERQGVENVKEGVIQRMSDNFQAPNDGKYAWEHSRCVSFVSEHSALYAALRAAWTKVPRARSLAHVDEKERERSRKANAKNLRHRSDLKLRKAMSQWMRALQQSGSDAVVGKRKLAQMSKQMSVFKKETLRDAAKCDVEDEQEMDMMTEGVEQQFNDLVADYCAAMGIKLCDEQQENADAH